MTDMYEQKSLIEAQEDMYLVCMNRHLKWVSKEVDEDGNPVFERKPKESVTKYKRSEPFYAAGKEYKNFYNFLKSEDGALGEDVYGRTVVCTKQRFPCFDSYDYLYENRYYHQYFIRHGNTLTEVHIADDSDIVRVTEDVDYVNIYEWTDLKLLGCFRPEDEE